MQSQNSAGNIKLPRTGFAGYHTYLIHRGYDTYAPVDTVYPSADLVGSETI